MRPALAAGLLALVSACDQRAKPAPRPPPPAALAVSWTTTMQSKRRVVPAIAEGARRAGCTLSAEKDESFVAVCNEQVLFCKQRGREVVRGCAAPADYERCKALWRYVLEAIPRVGADE